MIFSLAHLSLPSLIYVCPRCFTFATAPLRLPSLLYTCPHSFTFVLTPLRLPPLFYVCQFDHLHESVPPFFYPFYVLFVPPLTLICSLDRFLLPPPPSPIYIVNMCSQYALIFSWGLHLIGFGGGGAQCSSIMVKGHWTSATIIVITIDHYWQATGGLHQS